MRKVFLESLPKQNGYNDKNINWIKSVGCKIKFAYDDIKGEFEIIDYESQTQYLFIKYLENDIFKISAGNLKNCRLGGLLCLKTNKFKIDIGTKFKDSKRDLSIMDREYRKDKNNCNWKWYKYTCHKCGWTGGWMEESNLIKGKGCSCCANQTTVEGINDIPTTASWMIPYFQGGYDEAKLYTCQSSKKIISICPDCSRIKGKEICISQIYSNHSLGCSCSDGQSYPFKFMFSILEQLNILFETEYNPDWIKPMRYDFYFELNNKKYIVEMDGGFHFKDNNMSGQTKEKSKEIDDYKDKTANIHDIEVIRINSNISELKYIKNNILISSLSHLFDLNKIDWDKCIKFTLNNFVKTACGYKKNNNDLSTYQIGIIMKLHTATIRNYLKQGNDIGWCNYDVEEEIYKRNHKGCKKVEIFKNQVSLGIFESCSKLGRESERLFGVLLRICSITKACNSEGKQYKGYIFKFV